MDNQYTAGQYENNCNFFNVWNIPNLIPNDSVNLNNYFTENFGENNQSTTPNKTDQVGLSCKQSSSPLFLDDVFEILDNFIKSQIENCNPQNHPGEYSSKKQLLHSTCNQEFQNRQMDCTNLCLTHEESFQLCNDISIKPVLSSGSNECLSNDSASLNQILSESVSNVYAPNSSICHLEKGISADDIRIEVDSPLFIPNSSHFEKKISVDEARIEVDSSSNISNSSFCHFEKGVSADDIRVEVNSARIKTKIRKTVFTSTQLEELNAAFERSHYLNPDTLEKLVESLELPKNVIKVWFCNKRSNWKKQNKKLHVSNINLKNSISSNLNDRRKNFVENPMSYEIDQNSNQMNNIVKSPENYTYFPNITRNDNPQLNCTVNFLPADINKQNFSKNGYPIYQNSQMFTYKSSTHPVSQYSIRTAELSEGNVLYTSKNMYFEEIVA